MATKFFKDSDDTLGGVSKDDALGGVSKDDALGGVSKDDALGGVSKDDALPPVETGGYSWATLTALSFCMLPEYCLP
jgi:hypothetical protein